MSEPRIKKINKIQNLVTIFIQENRKKESLKGNY